MKQETRSKEARSKKHHPTIPAAVRPNKRCTSRNGPISHTDIHYSLDGTKLIVSRTFGGKILVLPYIGLCTSICDTIRDLGCKPRVRRSVSMPIANPSTVFAQVEESSQFFLHVAVSEQDKARSNQAHYEYYTAARYANVCVSIAFDTHNHGSADTLLALLPAPFSALRTHAIASASMIRPSASPRPSQSMQ